MPVHGGSSVTATHGNAGIAAWRFNMNAQIASYEDCVRALEILGDEDGEGFATIGPNMTLIYEGHDQDGEEAAKERSTCSTCLARTYRQEECVCDAGGDAEDFDVAMEEENAKRRTYAIELYDTKIIRYYPDGTFSVGNGGFSTPTTRERLQAVLPNGFRAYHCSTKWIKGGLGLTFRGMVADAVRVGWAKQRKTQPAEVLWPLNHDVRIDSKTGKRVEGRS